MTVKFSKDTRTLEPGDTYVALRGERYDGHDFIAQALEKGAGGLIVEWLPADLVVPPHVVVHQVADSLAHLAQAAHQRVETLRPTVVAVTGSVGKTTAKNAIVTVLSQAFPVVTNQGNLNTLLGLALTVLNELHAPGHTLVVEMGAYQRGELAELCRVIPPDVSVVLNVHPVHLESMGSLENVALAKGEIVEALAPAGMACLNADDARVRAMAARCPGRVLFYGTQPGADVSPARVTVEVPLLGPYRMTTALAAFCAGQALGMPDTLINAGLAALKPVKGRLVRLAGVAGTTLLDDTYNASPVSALAALDVLRAQPAARRVAFLGDMLELAAEEVPGHRRVVERALEVADVLVLVGPRMAAAAGALERRPEGVVLFESSSAVVAALRAGQVYHPTPGDAILIKGSAGMRMERIVEALLSPELDARELLVRQDVSWQ